MVPTRCPLADGYISVMNVELNIQEMLELGKTAQAARRDGTELDTISIGSRYQVLPWRQKHSSPPKHGCNAALSLTLTLMQH